MIRVRSLSLTRLCCRNVKWPSSSVSIAVSATDESLATEEMVGKQVAQSGLLLFSASAAGNRDVPGCEC